MKRNGRWPHEKFQSLFSWMLLWKLKMNNVEYCLSWVSILVLLDVALKDCKVLRGSLAPMFQSLFSWMLLWKSIWRRWNYDEKVVSILVLLDVALKANFVPEFGKVYMLFQSLFSWMLLWKLQLTIWLFLLTSFNPCSLGCCSERLLSADAPYAARVFQSLFSWMLLWKCMFYHSKRGRIHVSILVLLDVALKVWTTAWMEITGVVSILVLLDVALKE